MSEFSPLIMLLIFWIIIGLPVSIAKKAANQKRPSRPASPKAPEGAASSGQAAVSAKPERLTTLTPCVSVTGHDDSVYQGSMNAFTGEGYDPCHEEQMLPMTQIESEPVPQPRQAHSGLNLGWTGNDVVRGIVMSEILKRKH